MSIVKRNSDLRPFYSNLFDDFFDTWPKTINEQRGIPALNVKEDDKNLTLELQVPGMKKEDIKLEYKDGFLTISGEQNEEKEEQDGKQKFLRREFTSVSFHRTIELPEDKYDVGKAEAVYKDGILDITMPKNEERAKLNKTIQVK